MPDSLMYQSDGFVVLEANQPEQFLTEAELLDKLKACLSESQGELPRDLQKFTTLEDQAKYLMDTSCELDLGPGTFLQWYVVRLEKS
ncbi:chlororespiratory reduction protein 7 [Roseofilum capinflatum]|uniref:Chlororespiratory reduction protein 7 n=1 Tax=Roseofilum capinflatum BLCC-M114 TaxID=3022440 RepID=A0ABT7BBH2_9CYAN|nr:chlororespiratory reduction protein 7 [Roseofilum capinflatum]MDJ1176420.1 chlororespiratory reduction protein 7 [Roseofilum capinflatum BLCC-M114]